MRTLILFAALIVPGTALACGGGSCPLDGTGTAAAAAVGLGIAALLGKLGLFK